MLLLRRRVPIPALNRWLQVFPVVSLFLIMMSLHNIFGRAELYMSGVDTKGPQRAPDSEDDDADLGNRLGRAFDNAEHRRQGKRRWRITVSGIG